MLLLIIMMLDISSMFVRTPPQTCRHGSVSLFDLLRCFHTIYQRLDHFSVSKENRRELITIAVSVLLPMPMLLTNASPDICL